MIFSSWPHVQLKDPLERFYLLAPALVLLAVFVIGFVAFSVLSLTGRQPQLRGVKHNQLFGPFLCRFLVWMMSPAERLARVRAVRATSSGKTFNHRDVDAFKREGRS